jgi:hypothetical protein
MEILLVKLVYIRYKIQCHPAISNLVWNGLTNNSQVTYHESVT